MSDRIKIGEKIKKRRIELKKTQNDICGEYMTRNMLSLIENGSALPSVDTAEYLANRLDVPLPYLFSDDDDLFVYLKNSKIAKIRDLYKRKNYDYCMKVIDSISGSDDELDYIYALCSFNLGKKMLINGSLQSANKYLNIAVRKAESTVYDIEAVTATIPLYMAVIANIQAPLLEFDDKAYLKSCYAMQDYEFFKYVTMDSEFSYANELYSKHLEAKNLIKRYKYGDAISILLEIEESKGREYNAFVLFGVYSDLENAYKQIGDFENAYRYSSKRMSMMSGFKS